MIALLILILGVAQEGTWSVGPLRITVGDSIRVTASFRAGEGTSARIVALESNPGMELLEAPRATRIGDRIEVSFTVAFFLTGTQPLLTPAVELIDLSGDVVTIPAQELQISVISVLPEIDSIRALKPGFDPIPRPIRRVEPLVYLELAVVFTAFLWWALRMRSPLPEVSRAHPTVEATAPLATWAEAGEIRAVSEVSYRRLRGFLGELTDRISTTSTTEEILEALEPRSENLPMREISALLSRLDRVAFAPTHGDEVTDLADQVDDLIAELQAAPRPGEPPR